jgi:hypothetical protein
MNSSTQGFDRLDLMKFMGVSHLAHIVGFLEEQNKKKSQLMPPFMHAEVGAVRFTQVQVYAVTHT